MMQIDDPKVERLLDLVSSRVGVIRALNRVTRGVDEPSPPILYHALLSHYDFKKGKPLERASAGKGVTEEEAIGGAIGEAIERYCGHHPDLAAIRKARWGELNCEAVSPPECVLYSEMQYAREDFAYPRWTEQTETSWLPARQLPSGREVLLPASFIYLNYSGKDGEEAFCPATSNGLAAGPDLEAAVLAGLSELVERDGFIVHWMNRLPAPEIDFDGGVAGAVRSHYRRFNVDTRVFNVSTDIPMYSMMAVSLSMDAHGPAALVGLGCHLDPRTALTKALFEICQVRPGETRKFLEEPPAERLKAYQDVKTLHDHSAFLTIPERLNEMGFLLENGRRQRLEDLPNRASGSVAVDLEFVVTALSHAGCRVAYADITTPDVRPIGIRVVRTIATGLQPIHFGYGEERLGGRRLFELPRTLGYVSQVRNERDLNPCPHPLA
jgi:ribosomal protein S12 methylthiotransferase accessory factor